MRLKAINLRWWSFAIQFEEIMNEFGNQIPWLAELNDLRRPTDRGAFKSELIRRLGQNNDGLTAYQFVDGRRPGPYLGGLLHFEHSPEKLSDSRNRAIAERLAQEGAGYISCLQVTETGRGQGHGTELMKLAITKLTSQKGAVWGVTSSPTLAAWYQRLGAQCLSDGQNDDHLWLVYWPAASP